MHLPGIGVLYNVQSKPVEWIGRSLEDLRAFPAEARTEAGHELFLVQQGEPRKTTRRTSGQDLETARRRYREMLNQRSEEK
jgi:phage-related protein